MADAFPSSVIGVKVTAIVWGLLGGATAAALGPGSWQNRVTTAIVGGVFAVAFGPPVAHLVDAVEAERWGLTLNEIEPGMIYLCGIVGMMACGTVLEAMKRVRQKAPDLVDRAMPKDDH